MTEDFISGFMGRIGVDAKGRSRIGREPLGVVLQVLIGLASAVLTAVLAHALGSANLLKDRGEANQ